MSLSSRQRMILKYVVETYITTAEPVGSKLIAENLLVPVSSATVRNELRLLEEAGYLEQPHISAGRVPTDKAYRYYVDHLMQVADLSLEQKSLVEEAFTKHFYGPQELLELATEILAQLTGYVSLSGQAPAQSPSVSQLKYLSVAPGRALVVIILSAGLVENNIIGHHKQLEEADLLQIAQRLEKNLQNIPLAELSKDFLYEVLEDLYYPKYYLNQLLEETWQVLMTSLDLVPYFAGWQNFFTETELEDGEHNQVIYEILHDDEILVKLIQGKMPQASLSIDIGTEIPVDELQSCSLIFADYELGDGLVGQIGLLGPRRLRYRTVIPQILYIREQVLRYGNAWPGLSLL